MRRGTKIVLWGLSLVVFIWGSGLAQAQLSNDEVRSRHIKEADGWSGQNTNTGSGIKTNHITNEAVTTFKLAPQAVKASRIADGAVTTFKLAPQAVKTSRIADGAVTTFKMAPQAVKASRIANGAVTTFKLAPGAVKASRIANGAVTSGKIADGTIMPVDIGFYSYVFVVSTEGRGDFTNPVDALSAITDNSINTPYLVKIMPGVYDIGASSVQMKPYVDIEGCGENTTKITGTIGSWASGVVRGADNAELRLLSVENTGGGTYAMAIYNSSASPKLTQVTASASGGNSNWGVYNNNSSSPTMNNVTATGSGGTNSYGVVNNSSSPTMTNVTATGSGGTNNNNGVRNNNSSPTMTQVTATGSGGTTSYGVVNAYSSSPTMTNVTATASGGTYNYGVYNGGTSTAKIDHSVISGATNTISNNSVATIYVGNTRLDGGAVGGTGTTTCAGVYDENYAFSASTCP